MIHARVWLPEGRLWRWMSLLGGGILLLLLFGAIGWYWSERSEEASVKALASVSQLYREAVSEGKSEKMADARKALEEFLSNNARSRRAPLAAYYLGNLLYRSKEYEQARLAYAKAIARGTSDDLSLLSQLGIAYSLEAQGKNAEALRAYQDALAKATPKSFLYEELMVGLARMQESQREIARALETYRGLLKERPESSRADEVRSRIAMLEGQQNPGH